MRNAAGRIDELTREGELYERAADSSVRCVACAHRCHIPEGHAGVCHVRFNRTGRLMVPWGYVAGAQCDPIEKKPFFHAWPGSLAYSFGMLGCDFHCDYCQNWYSSQALRDPASGVDAAPAAPERLVEAAIRSGARAVVSTYNEPLITAEWATAIFRQAKAAGLATGMVSNGHGTPEVVDFLRPWLDLFKVDLKSMDDRAYRRLGGRLEPVLDTIRRMHALDVWVEVVTLLVPGFNDASDELERLAGFIASVSPDIPWHVTAFHPDYHMTGVRATSPDDLLRACDLGRRAGVRFVYPGNLPGRVNQLENTTCPDCDRTLVERVGYRVTRVAVTPEGTCKACGAPIPGRWS